MTRTAAAPSASLRVPDHAFPLLLTGATGLLGSRVLRDLVDLSTAGRIYVAGRRAPAAPTSPRIEHLSLDLAGAARALPPELRSIVHLAGEKRCVGRMEAVNHGGTLQLLRLAAGTGVEVFVHMSSVGVYGAPHNAGNVDEDFAQTPRNAYETSKAKADRAVLDHAFAAHVRRVVLRPTTVIDFDQLDTAPLLSFMRALARGHFAWPGAGTGRLNYVSAANVSAATLQAVAMRDAPSGAFNINTPEPLRRFVEAACDGLQVRVPRRHWPEWSFEALGRVGDALHRVGVRRLPLNSARMRELRNSTQYRPERFMAAYGFRYPHRVTDEARELARAYREGGRL